MPNYIIDLLDRVTLHNKRKKWVAADLNAEMIFERLKRIKKDLFLIVLMRNPVEAICASLYWRSYPSICQNSNKVFLYKLLSWKLTLFVAKKLKRKFPNSVKIIYFNELKKNSTDNLTFFEERFNFKKSFFKKNYFDYDKQKGTFCPDKKWNHLLKESDVNFIKKLTSSEKNCQKYFLSSIIFILSNFFLLAKINPLASKKFLDFSFFPLLTVKKFIYFFLSK